MIPAFIATILFSFSILFGHRAARMAGGVEANFWRLTCATLCLGVWSYGFGIGLGGDAFPWFFFSGVIGFGIGDVALYQALPRLGAPLSSMMTQCLAPPFAAITEWLWLGTAVTWRQSAAILAILAGVGLALAPSGSNPREGRREISWAGFLWGLLSALGTACGAVISRKAFAVSVAAHEPIDGANAAFQRVIAGLLVAGLTVAFFGAADALSGNNTGTDGGTGYDFPALRASGGLQKLINFALAQVQQRLGVAGLIVAALVVCVGVAAAIDAGLAL